MKGQTAAIICAYNEQKTITKLLKSVYNISLFDEVIVINDGSNDDTGLIIQQMKKHIEFQNIQLKKNKGKGFAMAVGIEQSRAEFLVFIDADLSNFTINHANKMLRPLINGDADMVLGQPTETLINYHVNPFKNLSGQRALRRKDILPILKRMKPSRYGVETLINMHFWSMKKVIKHVRLDNLVHPTKFGKTKLHKALKEFILEGCQILTTAFLNIDLPAKGANNKVTNRFIITSLNVNQ